MLISHKHKFIFIAVPKTATASIREIFKPYSDIISNGTNPPYDWHCRASDLKKHFQEQNWNWNQYFKFAFVRNPWDRLLSEFLYRKKRIKVFEESTDKPQYILDSEKILNEVGTFPGWITSKYIDTDGPTVPPQCKYIFDETDGLLVDFVGRFENLQGGVDTVCDEIGIQRQPMKQSNITYHKKYSEYYDDDAKNVVMKRNEVDIEYFNYKFG